jgi:hypothetical protein
MLATLAWWVTMRIRIITLMTFTPGMRLLPLTIPAIRLSVTVLGLDGSGLRSRCIWTSTPGVWSRATPTSLADTCHLARCVVLRVRLARINIISKSMARSASLRALATITTCNPAFLGEPKRCGSSKSCCLSAAWIPTACKWPFRADLQDRHPTGKRKVGGFDPAWLSGSVIWDAGRG